MDTKLKTNIKIGSIRISKKIKAFCYRVIAIGSLATMLFSGIMGRDALVNLGRMGVDTFRGDIFYLAEFQDYILSLYQLALTGYSGVGDDMGFPLVGEQADDLTRKTIKRFHSSVAEIKKDLLYHVDEDGKILTRGNVSYPLFSDYDEHLLLPEDMRLCCYWNGANGTLTFFDTNIRPRSSEPGRPPLLTDLQYKPTAENASHIRLILAIRDTESYSSATMTQFASTAKSYQQILIIFFSALALFVVSCGFCLLSRRTAEEMWLDYASLSQRLWLECKLLLLGYTLYTAHRYGMWQLQASLDYRVQTYINTWLYFVSAALLYLLWKDLQHNRLVTLRHSLVFHALRFVKEYFSGIRWYRKTLTFYVVILFSALFMLWSAYALYGLSDSDYFRNAPTLLLQVCYLLGILGVLLLIVSLCLRRFFKDVREISSKLTSLRCGESQAPLSLPAKSLLRTAAQDLNALENGIETAVEQQNRSNRMRVELITNVSHDLKTPLTSIINYADLLCEENLPAPASEYASALQAKAYRLKGMVQDVFELSKATSGNLPVELTQLDLTKLIQQTLADMDERIAESTLTFKLHIATEPIMIEADGEKLYRIFQNLFVNALQYSLEHSRVYVQLTVENKNACVRVKNTSRMELDFDPVEIMERFVRADSSRTTEGSGLGLSIVQSFTEACGGSFHITTDADMFTACVVFPLKEMPERTD